MSDVSIDYVTVATLKAALPDTSWGSTYDGEFARLVTVASREIDRLTGRQPGAFAVQADETRYYQGVERRRGPAHELWIDELAAAPTSVSMTIDTPRGPYTTLSSTDYYLWPDNWQAQGVPIQKLILDIYNGDYAAWYPWPQAVKVVGKFGYSTIVPADIQQAALILAARAFKRAQQAYADTGAIIALGQMTFTKQLDPEVEAILSRGGYLGVTI